MLKRLWRWALAIRIPPCWFGCHAWSMPGGWCEECGLCDRFFGGHERCGRTCEHFEAEKHSV